MTENPTQAELFGVSPLDEKTIAINARCRLQRNAGHCLVSVNRLPFYQFGASDKMAEANAMLQLVQLGYASQVEVANAFGVSSRSVRRYQERLGKGGGLSALHRRVGYPPNMPRLSASQAELVGSMRAAGLSLRQIAQKIGVTEKAVRKRLWRLGWRPAQPEQLVLPDVMPADPKLSASKSLASESAQTEQAGEDPVEKARASGADPNLSALAASEDEPFLFSLDTDPASRTIDRFLAHMGMLADAKPLFQKGERVPGAGVLLAVPHIQASGVFGCAREVYGSLAPSFYGLRTTLLTLILMALLRIKRPEGLKEHPPEDLGRVMGLDRAPEVKTLRRKLSRLAAAGRAVEFGQALAKKRVEAVGNALGFLYVDGHVRVYHGQRTLPKAHVARMRLAMPATTDYWVNDSRGDPLLVITAEANAGLTKMLPLVLAEAQTLLKGRRSTVVFDRGGWSPKLFQTLLDMGFDVMTYRKGRCRKIPKRRFQPVVATIDGRKVEYELADQEVRLLKGKLKLRQVTRLCENGHQTQVLTSLQDLSAAEVLYRMFDRWRQENFFKYLREEMALDALVDYQTVADDPTRTVPNAERLKLDAVLKKLRTELEDIQAEVGFQALTNEEKSRPTMRGFKIAHAGLNEKIDKLLKKYTQMLARRDRMPKRVPVGQTTKADVIKLAPERKHLTDLLKMVAYQTESELYRLLSPHYARHEDEGRTMIQTALSSSGDLEVRGKELWVRLSPLSSPHRTTAIAKLCEDVNQMGSVFPGTDLKMRFSIGAPPSDHIQVPKPDR